MIASHSYSFPNNRHYCPSEIQKVSRCTTASSVALNWSSRWQLVASKLIAQCNACASSLGVAWLYMPRPEYVTEAPEVFDELGFIQGKTWDTPPKLPPPKNFHNQNEISQVIHVHCVHNVSKGGTGRGPLARVWFHMRIPTHLAVLISPNVLCMCYYWMVRSIYLQNASELISKHLFFQNFLGGMPPAPPPPLVGTC